MSFLTPLFLLGGLAVAGPIIFHLIRRSTRQRVSFSSLMFLKPSPPKLTHRSRLEHILLLILRCAVICLLALGFARPFIKKAVITPQSDIPARRIVVLVDSSASMRRPNLWSDAQSRVRSNLGKTTAIDRVALFTFDKHIHPLMTFEQWDAIPASERTSVTEKKLAELSPGWLATDLGSALVSAAESLADTTGKTSVSSTREVILISDLQEGSRLEPLQNYEWPKDIRLTVEALHSIHTNNAGLQLVTSSEDGKAGDVAGIRVRVTNESLSKKEQFQIGWAQHDGRTFSGKPIDLYVPAGQSRTTIVPLPPSGVAAERIILQGDDDDFDNSIFVVPPEQARISVLYCGADSETDSRGSLYFLKRAFQPTQRQAVQVVVRPDSQPLPASDAEQATLIIVTAPLRDDRAQALHDLAAGGKTVLLSIVNPGMASTAARVLDLNRLDIQPGNAARYAMLSEIDFRHPFFAPFADPRFSDFTKIHFWKFSKFDAAQIPNAHILAKFDSGDPALSEIPLAKGRVIMLASGWGADDSQLALSTKFVPLLYAMLERSLGRPELPAQFFTGDPLPIASIVGSEQQNVLIHTPDGSEVKFGGSATNFVGALAPGIYRVSTQPERRLAVNLDAAESRTAPLSPDELEKRGVPVSTHPSTSTGQPQQAARLQNAELENRQKLWRDLLIAAMVMLLLEAWLAGKTARSKIIAV